MFALLMGVVGLFLDALKEAPPSFVSILIEPRLPVTAGALGDVEEGIRMHHTATHRALKHLIHLLEIGGSSR